MRTATTLSIYVELERDAAEPMAAQLARQLRQAIIDGRLAAGSRLPSSRTLARMLGVSRPLVQEAYHMLQAEDRIESRRGSGTYVKRARPAEAADTRRDRRVEAPRPAGPVAVDLTPVTPPGEDFPMPIWRAAWRRATHRIPRAPERLGEIALRRAVAVYLRTVRGMEVEPENVLITAGARDSLELVFSTIVRPGGTAAVEDPYLPAIIRMLHERGVTTMPVPVDAEGAVVSAVPPPADAVVVRPSHQMPLAVEMSPRRRHLLIEQAAAYDRLVVENDQEHDFTDTIRPQTLWDLSRNHTDDVVYLGCLRGLLPGAVSTGYLVARGRRLRELTERLPAEPSGIGSLIQRAAAELLRSVESGTWTGRLRQTYQARRRLIADLLAGHPAVAHVNGLNAGGHAYVELRPAVPAARVAAALAERGVTVPTSRDYEWSGLLPRRNGILIGHSHLTQQALSRVLRKVVACLHEMSRHEAGDPQEAYPRADPTPVVICRFGVEKFRTASQSRRSMDR